MSNLIQDKILALAPAATVKEGEVLTVTVPAENFHAVAEMLRDGEFRAVPMSSYVNEYLTEISTYMTEALAGNMTVEDAAKAVVEAVQPMADEAAG